MYVAIADTPVIGQPDPDAGPTAGSLSVCDSAHRISDARETAPVAVYGRSGALAVG